MVSHRSLVSTAQMTISKRSNCGQQRMQQCGIGLGEAIPIPLRIESKAVGL
jgi:hypothetical protein